MLRSVYSMRRPLFSSSPHAARLALLAALAPLGCDDEARVMLSPVADPAFLGSVSIEIPGSE